MRVLAVAAVLVSCAPGPDTEPTPLEQRVPAPNWGDLVIPTTTTTSTTVPVPVTAPPTTAPPQPPQTTAPRPVVTNPPRNPESGIRNPERLPGGGHLASIRECESSGDYSAVSPSGKHRGAYQADRQTWDGYGGYSDPAKAPPAVQDAFAADLYDRRGSQPWPNCG